MNDYKNDSEIVENTEYFLDGSEVKISLVICCWNTSHLLKRSIETWCQQDMLPQSWELIVIDDSSQDDVLSAIQFAIGKINLRYIKLHHNFGMRGNTKSFNVGFAYSRGEVLAETTPETIFTPDMVRKLYEPHLICDRIFVAAKTYNLTQELQLQIDSVNWREDVSNIMQLDGFFNDWTLNNFKNTHFGTHQTCSIKKKHFYELFPLGFPLYGDYGSEDPRYCGIRAQMGIKDMTIMQPMAFHQWHPPYHYWMAKGLAPHANRHGHSTSNFLNDKSGEVPEAGTSLIWDGGSHEKLSPEEIAEWAKLDEVVRQTGCKIDF